MQSVLMAIAVVKDSNKILMRKMDPAKNPYTEPWALFGGRIEGEGTVQDLLNVELKARWNFTVTISEKLWWDEETKTDHDGIEKRFVYVDAICEISEGTPNPVNPVELLEWANIENLQNYDHNPPGRTLFKKLGYIK